MPRNRPALVTFAAILAAFALLFSACGGSDTATDGAVGEADDAVAEVETETEVEAEAETEADPETEAAPADDPEESGDAVAVSLFEWAIEAPTSIEGGSVTFAVSNTGSFPHEFAIARGDSYDTLPQLDNGAVDEEALGADWLGRTDRVAPGETVEINFELAPGNYVFVCNINSGPNAHAAQGQVLSVTVS